MTAFPMKEKPRVRPLGPRDVNSETVLGDGSLVRRGSVPMRIGEYVFAVQACRWWDYTLGNDKNRPQAGSCGRPNDIMNVLAQRAIRMSRTVRMEVHQLDSGSEDEQEC